MEPGLKQRLTGAAVLVILAVIFIPMLLDTAKEDQQDMGGTNIPAQPADMPAPPEEDFSSRVVPLPQPPVTTPVEESESVEPAPLVEGPAPESTATAKVPPTPEISNEEQADRVGVTAWVVQLGSFSSKDNAESLNQKLREAGFKAFVEPLQQNGSTAYRVRVGPELKRSDADSINERLKNELQLEGMVVHYP